MSKIKFFAVVAVFLFAVSILSQAAFACGGGSAKGDMGDKAAPTVPAES